MKTENYVVTGPQPLITDLAADLRSHLRDGITVDVQPVSAQSDPRSPKNQFPFLELALSIPVHLISAAVYDILKAKIEAIRSDRNLEIASKEGEESPPGEKK